MTFIGKKHFKGESNGKSYDFYQLAFLDSQPDDRVTGNWVLIGTPGPDCDQNLEIGKDYKVYPSYNKGRCTIVCVFPI